MSLSVCIKKRLGNFALDIQFEAEHETLALLGASGCGKSMTLKCIAGIETPDEGSIVLDGRVLFDSKKRINLPPQKRKVGYLFQNYALFPNMTVRQNVASGVKGDKQTRAAIAEAKMKALYLDGLEDKYPNQLSGGQQQRVALARILASEPEVILLDEPFAALDSYLKWKLEQELIRTLDAFPGISIFVSHNRDEVYRVCDQVCVIDNGASEPVLSVQQLFSHPPTLSSALLTGCKNYSNARRLNDTQVEAIDCGVTLTCEGSIPEELRYIGVRAHFISPTDADGENVIPCKIMDVTQDLFSTVITVQSKNSPGDSDFSLIRVELSQEAWQKWGNPDVLSFYVKPSQILMLK